MPEFLKRKEIWILLSMTSIYFFSFFQRVAVPGTIFDELQRDFNTSAGMIAGLSAIYLYLYGFMQLAAGILADRIGAAREALLGGLLLAIGSVLFPLASDLGTLYGARILIGIGASLIYISLLKVSDELFAAHHFVMLVGLVLFLGYSGGLAGTFPFERLTGLYGWRKTLLGAGVLCTMAFLSTLLLLKYSGMLQRRPGIASRLMLGKVLRNKACLPNFFVGPLNFAVYFVIQSTIGKKFLADVCGMSSAAAASFTFIMMLVTMSVALSGGFISKHMGNRRIPIIKSATICTMSGMILILLALHFKWHAAWFLTAYILLAFASLSAPSNAALMKELNHPSAAGTALGAMNAATYLAVAILSNSAGLVLDIFRSQAAIVAGAIVYPRAAYQWISLTCLATCLTAFIMAHFLKEPQRQTNNAN